MKKLIKRLKQWSWKRKNKKFLAGLYHLNQNDFDIVSICTEMQIDREILNHKESAEIIESTRYQCVEGAVDQIFDKQAFTEEKSNDIKTGNLKIKMTFYVALPKEQKRKADNRPKIQALRPN